MAQVGAVAERCRALHDEMLAAGLAGQVVPKAVFERAVVQGFGLAPRAAADYLKAGEALELWRCQDGRQGAPFLVVGEGPPGLDEAGSG